LLSAVQELVLDAALAPDPRAREAWARVAPEVQRLDDEARRLLPLVALNLGRNGARIDSSVPGGDVLAAAYQHSFVANAAFIGRALPVLREFARRGLRFALLKGASLALPVYGDWGARTLSDIDVLVDIAALDAACAVLQDAGFVRFPETWEGFPRNLRLDHAHGFGSPEGGRLDLHWNPLHAFPWEGWLDDHWRHAEPGSLEGVPLLRLAPADELFVAAIHGAHDHVHKGRATVQSVADVVMITRAAAERLDWPRVCELARTRGFARTLHRVLAYAAGRFGARVPPQVQADLAALPMAPSERIEAAGLRLPAGAREIACEMARYARMRRAPRYRPFPGGLLRYLVDAWSLRRPAQVPGELVRRLASKARGAQAHEPGTTAP
jgi:hypothetical protein